ncbi:hypothetical protein [Mycobacterium sp. NPDC006124]|uniref:hypothetical protein n=1 Tax=Mycobacterium sp. NPDC006124 TaxID=3156729 RepID=UPI0033BE235E
MTGRRWFLVAVAGALLVAACTPNAGQSTAPASAEPTTASGTTTDAPAVDAPVARTVNWFDLAPGDCLAGPPPVDPTVIGVAVVDCTSPHRAEVFRRAPLAVDTAVADVATAKCDDGFTAYTGEPVDSGTFTITYLVDSNQNRTSSNPDPSTVICMLEAADGRTLTAPARR